MNFPINTPVRIKTTPGIRPQFRGLSGVVTAHLNPWQVSHVVTFADGSYEAFDPADLEAL